MACCTLALAFVYQLVDAWCRLRQRLRGAPGDAGRTRVRPTLPAPLRTRPLLWLALVLEFAAAGALAHTHEDHLRAEAARLLFGTTTLAGDLCRSVAPRLPQASTHIEE